MFTRLRSTIRALLGRDRFEREMADEMRFHMAAYANDLVRAGMSPDDAERQARLDFGAVEAVREDCREARGLRFVDELRQDVRYAMRQMARSPGFSVAVIVSLALGIGANTAIFSLMDAVLFRTVPVADPERLYFLEHRGDSDTTSSSNYPLLERYKAVRAFAGVTASDGQTFTVGTSEGQERVEGQYVSGNYHAVLGIPMSVGRGFSNEPDQPSAQPAIAVISDDYWKRRFARSPLAIGQTLIVNDSPVTIVGVTRPEFHGLNAGWRLDITLPLSVRALREPEFLSARDGWTSLTIIARLAPGVTGTQALSAADAVFRPFWMEPENAWARDERAPERSAVLVSAANGSTDLKRRYTTPLRILMAMVGIVLLVACANVANLLLARAAARTREVAVRLSIGAERARLVRQFLTESLMYSVAGGIGGVVIAVASAGVVVSSFATGQYPMQFDVELNHRVLGFTILLSILTGIAFGLIPAFTSTRVDLTRALKEGAVGHAPRRRLATGKLLVATQIALCVVVITTAGLLVRTLRNLRTFDAGFRHDNILLFNLSTWSKGFTPDRRLAFYHELELELRGLPGVTAVSLSDRSPMDMSAETRGVVVPGAPPDRIGVSAWVVTPDFFPLFDIRVVRGRLFSEQDRHGAQRVAVVNEAMARFYFGTGDPIGRTLRFGTESTFASIVGVVPDMRHEGLRDAAPATVYTVMDQPSARLDGESRFYLGRVTVAIRSPNDPRALASAVLERVRALSENAVIWYVRTMEQQLDAALIRERLLARLSTGFGVLALLLAFVGLYGVMSYRVVRRTREIGVRLALGATRSRVVRQVFRETLWVAGVGVAIGLTVALVATKVVAAFLFGLSPRDPAMFASVALALLATAVVAALFPARRAAGVEPMRALRAE